METIYIVTLNETPMRYFYTSKEEAELEAELCRQSCKEQAITNVVVSVIELIKRPVFSIVNCPLSTVN
jgi:hypothetical protein